MDDLFDGRPFRLGSALGAGIEPVDAQRSIRRGTWVRTAHGVYVPAATSAGLAAATPAETAAVLGGAALEVVDGDCLSHEYAAVVHGFDLLERPPERPTITRAKGRGVTPDYTNTARLLVSRLWPGDVVEVNGVAVSSPARTAVDYARTHRFRAAVVLLDSVLRSGVTVEELLDVAAQCRGFPGVRRAVRAINFASALSETPLESVSRVAWYEEGLPEPELQVTLGDAGPDGRVDFYWPERRTVGEADGTMKYTDPAVVHAQEDRADRIERLGLVLVRWGWRHVQPRTQRAGANRVRAGFARAIRRGYLPASPINLAS